MGGKKNKEPSYETAMEKLIELSGKDRNGEDENPEFKGNLDDYMNYFLGSRISLQKITSADGDEKIPLQVFVRDSNLISKLEELFSKLKNYNSKRLDLSHIHQIFLLLLQNGFEEKLTTLLRNIKEDIFYSISDINKIKIDSDYMWNFSRESHRTIINIKFIKLLQKTIKPHYIELSEKELKKENKKQYIDRLSKGKNHVIVINLDEVKDVEGFKAEAYAKLISDEKEKFRRLAYSLVDDDDGKAFFNNLEKTHPQEDMKVLREYFALLKEEFERKGVINKIKKTLDDMTQTERNFVKKILISLPKSSKQYIFSQYDPQVGNDLMNAMNGGDIMFDNTANELEEIIPVYENVVDTGSSPYTDEYSRGLSSIIGYERLTELYNNIFNRLLVRNIESVKGIKPEFVGIKQFKNIRDILGKDEHADDRISLAEEKERLKKVSERKEVLENVYQLCYLYEFSKELSKQELLSLAKMLYKIDNSLQMSVNEYQPYAKNMRYIWPSGGESDLEYQSILSRGSGFEGTNIIQIKDTTKGKYYLSVNLPNLSLDNYFFVGLELAYFLSHQKFIERKQLYYHIYSLYAQINNNPHNPIERKKLYEINHPYGQTQYSQFMEYIIMPLSKEMHQDKLKASSVIAVGPPGTGKSQLASHLLNQKNFEYEGQKFTLNANVVPLNIMNLGEYLTKDFSTVKQRLSTIKENTGLPIIIAIEDIDTLIEKNPMYDQLLTTFFEGVGSLDGVYMFTTTNHPEKIGLRLLRQNRLSKVISYGLISSANEAKYYLDTHLNGEVKKGLGEKLYNHVIEKYPDLFLECTPSTIGSFIDDISNKVKIEKAFNRIITEEHIASIYDNLHINRKELREQNEVTKKWLQKVKSKDLGSDIGFKVDKTYNKKES